MYKNIFVICVAILFVMNTGCQKKKSENAPVKTNTQLLTEKPWILTSYGPDNNNYVDHSEESIRDCDKDNTYTFSPNGSGVVAENLQICSGNDATNSFNWSFINNETGIDFVYVFVQIAKLTSDSMILREDNNATGKITLIYTH